MKKIFFIVLLTSLLTVGCSSEDATTQYDSNILVGGDAFIPTSATLTSGKATVPNEGALVFTLKKGIIETPDYEALVFKINYPLSSSSAPNGEYDFGIGVVGETLFAQGSYYKANQFFSLAGYTVKVSLLGKDNYNLEFKNIQAVNVAEASALVISGYFKGKMN